MKNRAVTTVPAVLLVFLVRGCGIIDLTSPEDVITNPSIPNQVVEIGEEISVTFPRPVDPGSAESAVRIEGPEGYVYGNFLWTESTAVFVPEEDLERGIRYELIVEGRVPAVDGGVLTPRVYVPFYVSLRPDAPPRVVSVEPAVLRESRTVITITFSLPMDGETVEISCTPDAGLVPEWRKGGTVLELLPGKDYPNGEVLRLKLPATATDTRGVPLGGDRDYRLAVEYDTLRPRVESIAYALSDWQSGFPPLGRDLDSIGPTDALRISFSEPMERGITGAGINLLPDPPGHRAWISDTDYVIVPELGWEARTEYLLTLGPPAADTAGNPLDGETLRRFTPHFGVWELEEVRPQPEDGPPLVSFSTVDPLVITPALYGGDYTFRLIFSEPAPSEDIENTLQRRVSVRALYPSSLSPPRITGLSWPDPRTLTLSLTGFERSGPSRRCFYSLELGRVREIGLNPVSQLIEAAE